MNHTPATAAIPSYLAGIWKADPVHSEIGFSVRQLMVGKVRGQFTSHDVTIVTKEGETYPTMSYRSTGIRPTDDGWVVDGELTVHGVTRQVPLAVEVNGFGPDLNDGRRAGFSATAQIHRGDFGIDRWTGGGAVVGDKVSISLEIAAVLQQ